MRYGWVWVAEDFIMQDLLEIVSKNKGRRQRRGRGRRPDQRTYRHGSHLRKKSPTRVVSKVF